MITKAMIMAAGAGTRLIPLTEKIPKPMVPVINTPIIELILKHLSDCGINDVIANTHYCAETIHEAYGGENSLGINFNYVYEDALSGTAGGVKKCEHFFDRGETFVVVSGDALTNVDIHSLYEKHKKSGAMASMALKEVPLEEVSHFGVVVTDSNSRIIEFQEKPRPEQAKSTLVNTGIYIFETEIFDYIPENTFYDFAKNVFPKIMADKRVFCGFKINDYWNDIGTINQYRLSSFELLDGVSGFSMAYRKSNLGWIAGSARISGAVSAERNIIAGENTVVEDNVSFTGGNIIGNGCIIKSGAQIKDSIIWDNVVIEENAVLDNCIVANNAVIKANTALDRNSVIPHDVVISHPEDLYRETLAV